MSFSAWKDLVIVDDLRITFKKKSEQGYLIDGAPAHRIREKLRWKVSPLEHEVVDLELDPTIVYERQKYRNYQDCVSWTGLDEAIV